MDPTLPAFEAVGALIIMGCVAAVFATGHIDRRYGGVIAIVFGILIGIAWATWDADVHPFIGGVNGAIAGLVASGLWSTGKNIEEVVKEDSDGG
jgi:hypothetical protein